MQIPGNLGKSATVDADIVDPAVDVYEIELDDGQASQTLQEPIVLDSDEENPESDIDYLAKEILNYHSSVSDSARELNGQEASQVPAIDGTSSGTHSTVSDGQRQPKDQPKRRLKRPMSEHLSTTGNQGTSACKLAHSPAIYFILTCTSFSNCRWRREPLPASEDP